MPNLHKDVKAAVDATQLGAPVHELISRSHLIKQGAEGKVYKSTLLPSPAMIRSTSAAVSADPTPPPPVPILLKYRFPKRYRHPTLDAQLTRQRLTSEARALVRCMKAGVTVPGLRLVDVTQGCLGMEWIDGWSVREILGGGQDDVAEDAEEEVVADESLDAMLRAIGCEIGKMHLADIIHGDLTTSNMMVRLTNTPQRFELVLIDFGLSSTSPMHEDRAVDLYVLERAFSSTHPVQPGGVAHFEVVLEGYREALQRSKKGEWERVEKRLEEVRMRGRKRSMVG
ncbi:EKC/KEOPS complex subunit BUD32 [Rhodotorula toruloides]|uniref:non-specific serine/threonine protein kinase n=1 Tax=Rhodotorula toruloides TaxID=5286 RepID=A0A0K3C7F4_RHOTO|nr:EKC/KEOPS complex subunit BUD32 [Rhodotorula toruloides]